MRLEEIDKNYPDHFKIGDKVLCSRSIHTSFNYETKDYVTVVHLGEVVGFTPKRIKVAVPLWDGKLQPSSYEKVVKVINPDMNLLNQMFSGAQFMYLLK